MKKSEIDIINRKLLDFIDRSPAAFQVVKSMIEELGKAGFVELNETEKWHCESGKGYYVVRNNSSIIAFVAGSTAKSVDMVCAHSDSPSYKIKENAQFDSSNVYTKLNVEKYGGMIQSSWFDRPLSAAGRVVCIIDGKLEERLVDLKKNMFIIPSVAIHMTRTDETAGIKIQTDMCPLAGILEDESEGYYDVLAQAADVDKKDILGADMFLYNTQPGCVMGMNDEFIGAPRIDDQACVFAGLEALIDYKKSLSVCNDIVKMLCVFDNEEVGSLTRQGADSDFLECTLKNIAESADMSDGDYRRMLAASFMISADNAHSVHPNHPEKADVTNRPILNKGVVIKYHGGQKYTTDGITGAVVKQICINNDIKYQTYHNNSDIAGGSTLGNIALGNVSIPAADIGIPQLAMHSAFETAGASDVSDCVKLMKAFYTRR